MKRNHVTTNAVRQMQRATPHRHWLSNAAHVAYQRAVKWYGAESAEAQAMLNMGVRPPSVLQLLRDQALVTDRQSRAERLLRRAMNRVRRPRSVVLPPELMQWAVQG
jgi:hypothetical protein